MESRLRGLKFNENDKVSQFIEINRSDTNRFQHFALNKCNKKKNLNDFHSRTIAKTRRTHHLTLMVWKKTNQFQQMVD